MCSQLMMIGLLFPEFNCFQYLTKPKKAIQSIYGMIRTCGRFHNFHSSFRRRVRMRRHQAHTPQKDALHEQPGSGRSHLRGSQNRPARRAQSRTTVSGAHLHVDPSYSPVATRACFRACYLFSPTRRDSAGSIEGMRL